MSGTQGYDDLDDYDEEFGEDARPNRDNNVLRTLRREVKSKDKTIKELQDRLDSLASQARERSVKDVLTAKGLNPKVGKFIPNDLTSEDEVMAWVEENSEIFGLTSQESSEGDSTGVNPNLQALSQIGQVQASGQPFDGDSDQLASLIRSARTPEELNQIIFGSQSGPDAY